MSSEGARLDERRADGTGDELHDALRTLGTADGPPVATSCSTFPLDGFSGQLGAVETNDATPSCTPAGVSQDEADTPICSEAGVKCLFSW